MGEVRPTCPPGLLLALPPSLPESVWQCCDLHYMHFVSSLPQSVPIPLLHQPSCGLQQLLHILCVFVRVCFCVFYTIN